MGDAMAVLIVALADDDSLFPGIEPTEGGNSQKKCAEKCMG